MDEKDTGTGGATGAATADAAAKAEHVSTEPVIPMATDEPSNSYSMLEPRMKKVYGAYYKELYYTPERRVLDPKVQELISRRYSLDQINEGFERLGRGEVARGVIVF